MRKYIEIINEATAYKAPMRIHASRLTGRLMNLKPRMSKLEGTYLLKDLAMLCETILEWCEHRGEISMAMKQAVMQAKAYFPQSVEMCMTNPHVPRNVRDGIQLIRDELKHFNVVLESKKLDEALHTHCTACGGELAHPSQNSVCAECTISGDSKANHPDWYDRRDELEPGMVFKDFEGDLVMLDRRVPGDGTKWYVLTWWGSSWSHEDATIEPGDLRGNPLPDPAQR